MAIGKLIVKIVASNSTGGKALALCTEDGEMLPSQIESVVETCAHEIGKITVSFWIDGDKIRFSDNDG